MLAQRWTHKANDALSTVLSRCSRRREHYKVVPAKWEAMQAINFHNPATLHGWEHGVACSDRKCRDVLRDQKRGTVRLQASDSQTCCILRSVERERQTKRQLRRSNTHRPRSLPPSRAAASLCRRQRKMQRCRALSIPVRKPIAIAHRYLRRTSHSVIVLTTDQSARKIAAYWLKKKIILTQHSAQCSARLVRGGSG